MIHKYVSQIREFMHISEYCRRRQFYGGAKNMRGRAHIAFYVAAYEIQNARRQIFHMGGGFLD